MKKMFTYLDVVDSLGGDSEESARDMKRVECTELFASFRMYSAGMPFGDIILATRDGARMDFLRAMARVACISPTLAKSLDDLCERRPGIHKEMSMLYVFYLFLFYDITYGWCVEYETPRIPWDPREACIGAFEHWRTTYFVPIMQNATHTDLLGGTITALPDAFTDDDYDVLAKQNLFFKCAEWPHRSLKDHRARVEKIVSVRYGLYTYMSTTVRATTTYLTVIPLASEYDPRIDMFWRACHEKVLVDQKSAETDIVVAASDKTAEWDAAHDAIERWHARVEQVQMTEGDARLTPRITPVDVLAYRKLSGGGLMATQHTPSEDHVVMSEVDLAHTITETAVMHGITKGTSTTQGSLIHFMEAVLSAPYDRACTPSLLGSARARHAP